MVKLASLFLTLYFATHLDAAVACSCLQPGPPALELSRADAVFSGTVTDISPSGEYQKTVTFDVDKTWKGINNATIIVSTSADGASCGNSYEVGQAWLVYAYGKGNLSTNLCSRTTPITRAQEDLKVLGTGQVAPPAPPAQTNQPRATLEDSTIRLMPSGASFKIPPRWVGMYRSNDGNLFIRPEELERAKIGVGEWFRQYAEVINTTFPFENCSVHAGGSHWGNASGLALHMRAYTGKWSVEEVRTRVARLGIAGVLALDKRVSKVSFERVNLDEWQVSTLTFYLSFGDYGGTARIDFYAQSSDEHTAVLVFMSIEGDTGSSHKAEIESIVNSFSWKQ
jgi:hypothetical protein